MREISIRIIAVVLGFLIGVSSTLAWSFGERGIPGVADRHAALTSPPELPVLALLARRRHLADLSRRVDALEKHVYLQSCRKGLFDRIRDLLNSEGLRLLQFEGLNGLLRYSDDYDGVSARVGVVGSDKALATLFSALAAEERMLHVVIFSVEPAQAAYSGNGYTTSVTFVLSNVGASARYHIRSPQPERGDAGGAWDADDGTRRRILEERLATLEHLRALQRQFPQLLETFSRQ